MSALSYGIIPLFMAANGGEGLAMIGASLHVINPFVAICDETTSLILCYFAKLVQLYYHQVNRAT